MAETFKNFNSVFTTTGGDVIVVPSSLSGKNESCVKGGKKPNESGADTTLGKNVRTLNSVVQIHSMYMTNVWSTRPTGSGRYTESNFKHVDLYIKDENNTSYKVYIAHDVELVPGCPFYIEKNITLTPSQRLVAFAPSSSDVPGNSSININIVASAIEFLSDVE